MDIVTLTMNPAVDKSSSIDHVVSEKKLRCDFPDFDPGGGGLNVSRAIKKMGGESLAVFPAGGASGRMLIDLLYQEGLELQVVDIEGMTRENLTILEKASGQQYRFGMPGPRMSSQEWQACLKELDALDPPPKYLVASGSLPQGVPDDFYARLGEFAHSRSICLILDTSGEPLLRALGHGVYLIKPNLGELEGITGNHFESEQQQENQALNLIRQGKAQVVVVSLGAGGALLAYKDKTLRLHAPTVPIQSKVGAGDSMVGGMVLALSRGKSVLEAVKYGIAAGAAAVMTPGTDLCRGEDVDRLYQDIQDTGKRSQ